MQLRPLLLALGFLLPFTSPARAQDALVVATCGTLAQAYSAGSTRLPTVDVNGKLCLSGGGGGGGSPGGSNTQVQFNQAGSFGGSANFTWVSPNATIGVQQTTQGGLVLANTAAGAFATTIKSSNSATAAWTLTLPTTAGSNTNVLQTDGSGNTSWVAVSAGGVTNIATGTGLTGGPITTTGTISLIVPVTVASGGTNCTSASITCFNNITGFTASGTTGTTSTNLVFSTSPTLTTPVIGAATGTSLSLSTGASNVTIAPATANTEPLTVTMGTLTANTKGINITGTWNNAGVTFDAPLFVNITSTASAAASLLADFQVGGSSVLKVDKSGNIYVPDGSSSVPSYTFASQTNVGLYRGINRLGIASNGSSYEFVNNDFILNGTNIDIIWNNDTAISRFGLGILGVSASTNITEWQQYATTDSRTSPTNYARAVSRFTNNGAAADTWLIGTEKGGTGTSPAKMQINVAGTKQLDYAVTTAATFTVTPASTFVHATFQLPGINATTETDMLCFNTSTGLVTHSTIAQQCTVSDVNLKQNIVPIAPRRALQIALGLDPISFDYKPTADMGRDRHMGFTMQRVAQVEPELATSTGVKYGEMNPIWAGAIQALKADNDNLREELQELRRMIAR